MHAKVASSGAMSLSATRTCSIKLHLSRAKITKTSSPCLPCRMSQHTTFSMKPFWNISTFFCAGHTKLDTVGRSRTKAEPFENGSHVMKLESMEGVVVVAARIEASHLRHVRFVRTFSGMSSSLTFSGSKVCKASACSSSVC